MGNKKRLKNIINIIIRSIYIIVLIILGLSILLFAILDFFIGNDVRKYRIYTSPSKKHAVTLMYYRRGDSLNADRYFYIIEGEYKKKALPEKQNYIKYPKDIEPIFIWGNDSAATIYSWRSGPEINHFYPTGYILNFVVNTTTYEKIELDLRYRRIFSLDPGQKDDYERVTRKIFGIEFDMVCKIH
jgi:hypothetical protein